MILGDVMQSRTKLQLIYIPKHKYKEKRSQGRAQDQAARRDVRKCWAQSCNFNNNAYNIIKSTQKEIKYEGNQGARFFLFQIESVGGEWWVEYFVYYLSSLERVIRNESYFISYTEDLKHTKILS